MFWINKNVEMKPFGIGKWGVRLSGNFPRWTSRPFEFFNIISSWTWYITLEQVISDSKLIGRTRAANTLALFAFRYSVCQFFQSSQIFINFPGFWFTLRDERHGMLYFKSKSRAKWFNYWKISSENIIIESTFLT